MQILSEALWHLYWEEFESWVSDEDTMKWKSAVEDVLKIIMLILLILMLIITTRMPLNSWNKISHAVYNLHLSRSRWKNFRNH